MKQVLQNFKTGSITVEDVPTPVLRNGCVLVRNRASLISKGTEGGRVALGKMSLIGKARARPEQVKKVIQALKTEGLLATVNAVRQTLDIPLPIGYSCSGIVEATAADVTDLKQGTRVACGGSGIANHAEYVTVPRNLCVPIPDGVPFEHAAFTTVGSIAMQGIRMADLRLGENAVVIGLGLVGLLTALMLKASGCRVLGIDIDPERVAWVEKTGICSAVARETDTLVDRILAFTNGFGTDAVIITAAVASNDPVSLAGQIARFRGRIVVVGRTEMHAPRDTYLFKELQLNTSYAYGPGADDASYEKEGHDYPIGFIRWTENRNMECFLNLLQEGKIDIAPLQTHSFEIDNAPQAFDLITSAEEMNIGVILKYSDDKVPDSTTEPKFTGRSPEPAQKGRLRVGLIGAGSFSTNIMMPLLVRRKDVAVEAIVSSTGTKAAALSKKYNIPRSAADAMEIIRSPDIDAVFILTRHGTHASFAEQALLAGKHVFVEKPLALTEEELEKVVSAQKTSQKVLMVGFNRRFSPLALKLKAFFSDRCQPMLIKYRGNVGYRPPDHWLHDPVDGGGIILGEACHYIDYCRWLVDSPILTAEAKCLGPSATRFIPEDNVIIEMSFEDGTLAVISYVSNGAKAFSRERCEAHADARSGVWEDFRTVKLVKDLGFPKTYRNHIFLEKGYRQEVDAFIRQTRETASSEIVWLSSQLDSSRASITAAKSLKSLL